MIGVDSFKGEDFQAAPAARETFLRVANSLSEYPNIELHRSSYQDWILHDTTYYGLIHIDIMHTLEDTLACGAWAVEHARCVLFHDTESSQGVRTGVQILAEKYGKKFYNYPQCFGLGILI